MVTGTDGRVEDPSDVDDFFASLRQRDVPSTLVVHLHGGLVNESDGRAIAESIEPVYSAAEADSIFVVWKTGPFEILRNNLHEVLSERLFRQVATKLLRWVAGRLSQSDGDKAVFASPLPDAGLFDDAGRLLDFGEAERAAEGAPAVSDAELAAFEADVRSDLSLRRRFLAAAASTDAPDAEPGERAKAIGEEPVPTKLDRHILDLVSDGADGSKGLFPGWFEVVAAISKIFVRVLSRFSRGRGHGLACTITEEVCRSLYVDHVGVLLWETIKKESADAFVAADRGGARIVNGVAGLAATGHTPRLVVVGHSAGGVYVCHLLKHLQQRRDAGTLPDSLDVEVLLLAPACTHALFASVMGAEVLREIRVFNLSDERESTDSILTGTPVRWLYPRSLLYLVSGLAEEEVDSPLLGMMRFLQAKKADGTFRFDGDATTMIRALLGTQGTDNPRLVVAAESDGAQQASTSKTHGGFDEDGPTLQSIAHVLSEGWQL